jgi:hypothetical protein
MRDAAEPLGRAPDVVDPDHEARERIPFASAGALRLA